MRTTITAMTPRRPRRSDRLPSRRLARRSRGPLLGGLWLRLSTRWHARELDRQLAAGTDPMLSDELSLRVGLLGSPRSRTRLASGLSGALDRATGRHPPLVRTRLRRAEIEENGELVLALAERLRDGHPVGVQGLAMAARLLDDRSSPLYCAGVDGSLATRLQAALEALERGHRTAARTLRGPDPL